MKINDVMFIQSLKEELTCDDQKEKFVSTKEKVLLFLLRVFTNVLCIGKYKILAVGMTWKIFWEFLILLTILTNSTHFSKMKKKVERKFTNHI